LLAGTGPAIASVPVRPLRAPYRLSATTYRRITLVAVAALALIIVTGGAVRLTDSGLGCPDWPTCAQHHLVAAWKYHAMVEFTNRVFTVVVCIAVALAVAGALLLRPRRRDLVGLSLGLVAGVAAQVVLGGLTVLFKLAPPLVMAHFLLSLLVLWDAVVLHHRAGQANTKGRAVVGREVVLLGRLLFVTTAVVAAVGTAVTGSGPHSGSAHTARLPFAFRAVTEVHASLVWLLLGLTLASLFALHLARAPEAAQRRGRILLEVMVVQGAIGYAQYFTKVPALLVGFHLAGATAVWMAVIGLNLSFHVHPEPAGTGVTGTEAFRAERVLTAN
jgi:cytochrome c oxidase assembly protein subunit 15